MPGFLLLPQHKKVFLPVSFTVVCFSICLGCSYEDSKSFQCEYLQWDFFVVIFVLNFFYCFEVPFKALTFHTIRFVKTHCYSTENWQKLSSVLTLDVTGWQFSTTALELLMNTFDCFLTTPYWKGKTVSEKPLRRVCPGTYQTNTFKTVRHPSDF